MIERGITTTACWIVSALVAVALLTAGCSQSAQRSAPDPKNVRVSVADRAAYDAVVKDLRGDVVFVDFWAHWCTPCVKNFPHVIELADRDQSRGLSVVTVNMDAPEALEKTTNFLKDQRAGAATNLISKLGGGSQAMEAFEISNGSLPCYKLYDRKGQLRHTFALNLAAEKQFTLQEVDAAVEQLLAE
jgi:thiol-disulfide isomerase/thioredoxin